MMNNLRHAARQRGQGIVEYALLLALILGIAIALNSNGLSTAITDTFDRVAHALGIETDWDKWSKMNGNDLLADSASAEDRLKADREFLSNIGQHFLGMTKSEMASILGVSEAELDKLAGTKSDGSPQNGSVLVGHLYESRDAEGNLMQTGYDSRTEQNAQLDNFYNWGSKAQDGTAYDSSHRYLVSDYALSNSQNHYYNNDVTTGNGIHIVDVGFDGSGKVTSVNLAVNPKSGSIIQGQTSRADLNVIVNQ